MLVVLLVLSTFMFVILLAISWITCWVSSKILESSFQGLSSSHLKLAQNLICKTGKSIVFFHLGGLKKVSVKWKCLLFSVQIQSPWKIFWWLPNNFLCNSIKSTFNFAQKHSSKLMFLPENLDVFPKTDTGIKLLMRALFLL